MIYHQLRTFLTKQFTRTIHFLLFLALLVTSCSSVKQVAISKDVNQILNKSPLFSSQFTGFSLYDIEDEKFLSNYNGDLKFTPASNTKILTMYAVLKSFGDSIPSLLFEAKDSYIRVEPLGDPTFLYQPFKQQSTYDFLSTFDSLEIQWPTQRMEILGAGWAWDDYPYDFQPERSWWPIYGNTVLVSKVTDSTLSISPTFFEDFVDLSFSENGNVVTRDLLHNRFTAKIEIDTSRFEKNVPFKYSTELLTRLLSDTLKKNINFSKSPVSIKDPDTLFSVKTEHVLAAMMKPSDNFLAEQLLILAARKNDQYNTRSFIELFKKKHLQDLSELVWVDGSGLSRYNLISPKDQVVLLKKSLEEFGWKKMTSILPTGGEGTLKKLYLPEEDEKPFIYAKTGTLSNNHNLSGFLITDSGKKLIFSLMNNHYTVPTSEVKLAMQSLLLEIKRSY